MKSSLRARLRGTPGILLLALLTFAPTAVGQTAGQTAATPLGASDTILPEDLRPGMKGVGYTVVRGVEPVAFDVEIVGVLPDTFPQLDLVVARLTGLDLERSNVVSGMSGSPVFIDGRLLGAIAYRMAPFAHEAVAGIVPISAMLDVGSFGSDAGGRVADDPERIGRLLETAAALLTGGAPSAELEPMWSPTIPGMRPIATPVSLSGFRPEIVRSVAPLFESLGWQPVAGGVGGGGVPVEANLVPGGALSIQIMRGDVNVAASGTITWRDGDRLVAFGHPFLQGGAVDFPMTAARVLTVLSSASDSSKLTVAGEEILGAVRQDRLPAVMGVIGARPELIPIRLEIDRQPRSERISFEVVSDPILTPLYVFLGIVNAVQSVDQVYGEGSIELETRIRLSGVEEPVRFGNLFSSQNQAVIGLSSTLSSIFGFLYGNPFESVRIAEVDVGISLRNDRRSAAISRVWHDRTRVRPGEVVTIGVELQPHREPAVTETLTFRIPEGAPAGPITLLVGDASSIGLEEQSFIQGSFQPRDLDHLVRLLNGQRRADWLYLQASVPDAGAFVNGEILPALPPSVLEMLTSDRTRGDVVRLARTVVAEEAHPVDYVISGSHRIELVVRR